LILIKLVLLVQQDLEQFCEEGATFTYNSPDKHIGKETYGYSASVVVE
jgi:uncharacterized zinc-type alcohol dehydrogenase-like protein